MGEKYSYRDAFIHHLNAQDKFDYFFLGVILASLSLSIQSYDSTKEPNFPFVIIIISSWILFLFSLLAGFFRQEKLNLSYRREAELIPQLEKKNMFDSANRNEVILQKEFEEYMTFGEIQKNLESINDEVEISNSYLNKYDKHARCAYKIQKWSFFYAAILYILFKISDSTNISFIVIAISLPIIVLINIAFVKIYGRLLKKK